MKREDIAQVAPLNITRLYAAKAAYTTRRVPREALRTLLTGDLTPDAGDVVLACVDKLGKHKMVELVNGRRASLFVGDEIVVSYGHRYAPDQFEAQVPETLAACHLVASGGVASHALSRHDGIDAPTCITPLGLIADQAGMRINLRDWGLAKPSVQASWPTTIAVVGTAMNAGKTATAAHLIKGAVRAGIRTGAAKITGTGSGVDTWLMRDAGADPVLDFTDVGLVSTYLSSDEQIVLVMQDLIRHLSATGADLLVLEIADGLYQAETSALLSSPSFAASVDGVLFAAHDAMGAMAGVEWLRSRDLNIMGVSGTVTRSPLASREAARATGLPVFELKHLCDPALVTKKLAGLRPMATRFVTTN